MMQKAEEKGVKFLLPTENVIADAFDNDANIDCVDGMNIPDGWQGLDIGPKAIEDFGKAIAEAKTIVWNGPMGRV